MAVIEHDPNDLSRRILEATEGYEFRSFVIGIERPRTYDRENHEQAYRRLKIALGSALSRAWPGREVDFERPELRIELQSRRQDVRVVLQPAPLFIGGRYRKLSRDIPACRWMHMSCKGKGCPSCGFTGNICGPSIQELAEPAVFEAVGGTATFFHGAGREDIDVRMLGSGRPFVLEVRHPRRRRPDLDLLTAAINERAAGYAEVHRLALTTRAAMVEAKSVAAEKSYRARIRFEGDVPPDVERRIESLAGAEIAQLSPKRVMRRRGRNTVRRKRVLEAIVIDRDGDELITEIRTSSGTYVKELISGDDERTTPSIASVVGLPCECVSLDVVEIHWQPPWEE